MRRSKRPVTAELDGPEIGVALDALETRQAQQAAFWGKVVGLQLGPKRFDDAYQALIAELAVAIVDPGFEFADSQRIPVTLQPRQWKSVMSALRFYASTPGLKRPAHIPPGDLESVAVSQPLGLTHTGVKPEEQQAAAALHSALTTPGYRLPQPT